MIDGDQKRFTTDRKVTLFFLFLLMLLPLMALLPPMNWRAFVKGVSIVAPIGIIIYFFLYRFSYIALRSNGEITYSLMAIRKQIRISDITEIQRGKMYQGFSIFGHQAFIIYKQPDGRSGHLELSENLYNQKTISTFCREIQRQNKEIKINSYYLK